MLQVGFTGLVNKRWGVKYESYLPIRYQKLTCKFKINILLLSISFLINFLISFNWAQPAYVSCFAAPPDTIPFQIKLDLEDEFAEDDFALIDSLFEEESAEFNHYTVVPLGIFDTTVLNPYKVNLRLKKDTTNLKLFHNHDCDYAHPTCGNVTSDFGPRRKRFHYGIDLDLESGDGVLSAFEGIVRIVKYSPTYGYYVVMMHNNGLETLYAHLSKTHVKTGDYLQAGDLVGLGGNTGRSRGSHLHFEVRFQGQQINPRSIISFENYSCISPELSISSENFKHLDRVAASKSAYKAKGKSSAYKKGSKGKKGKKKTTGKSYQIRKGDTLSSIAKRNNTTVSKLAKANGISPKSKIKAGQKIKLK